MTELRGIAAHENPLRCPVSLTGRHGAEPLTPRGAVETSCGWCGDDIERDPNPKSSWWRAKAMKSQPVAAPRGETQ